MLFELPPGSRARLLLAPKQAIEHFLSVEVHLFKVQMLFRKMRMFSPCGVWIDCLLLHVICTFNYLSVEGRNVCCSGCVEFNERVWLFDDGLAVKCHRSLVESSRPWHYAKTRKRPGGLCSAGHSYVLLHVHRVGGQLYVTVAFDPNPRLATTGDLFHHVFGSL